MSAAQDCLVILHLASAEISGTVAWRREGVGERVEVHKRMPLRWAEASRQERERAIAELIDRTGNAAGVQIYSAFVCATDHSLRANFATGFADLGQEVVLSRHERDLALMRAAQQPIGTGRTVLHALPQRWSVRNRGGEREVEDPVGQRAGRLTSSVLLVTADHQVQDEMEQHLARCGIALEGLLAAPVALHRGLAGNLPKRGSSIVLDCGARQTSLLVHRKARLVHLETHEFGGDDLTREIARQLAVSWEEAERLKQEVEVGGRTGVDLAGQTYLWSEVQAKHSQLGKAAFVCETMWREFLKARAKHLADLALLTQRGRIHLVGRGAALGGLASLVKEHFALPVVLGTHHADREISSELADLIIVGLVRAAADVRARKLAERNGSGFHQVTHAASGLWGWLTAALR